MRTLGFPLPLGLSIVLLLAAGCATLDSPKPLTGADIVFLAKSGKTAPEIVAELKRTDTILTLRASDIVALHESGVPKEVLDHLQHVQIEEIRRRDRQQHIYWGRLHGGFGFWPRGR